MAGTAGRLWSHIAYENYQPNNYVPTPNSGDWSLYSEGNNGVEYCTFRNITAGKAFSLTCHVQVEKQLPSATGNGTFYFSFDNGSFGNEILPSATNLPTDAIMGWVDIVDDAAGWEFSLVTRSRKGSVTTARDTTSFVISPQIGQDITVDFEITFEFTESYWKFYVDGALRATGTVSSWVTNDLTRFAVDLAQAAQMEITIDTVSVSTLTINAGGEITPLIRPKSIKASRAMRGGGSFQFDYIDKNVANLATVLGYGLNKIYIADDSLSKVFHSGELTKIVQFKNKYQWRGNELIRRLLEILCNYSPVYYSGVIDTIEDIGAKIHERAKQDQTDHSGKYITITDSFPKRVIFEAKSSIITEVDRSTAFAPVDTEKASVSTVIGDYKNLYWKEPSIDIVDPYNAEELHGAYDLNEGTPEDNINLIYDCYAHIKENTVPQSLKLFIDFYALWHDRTTPAERYSAIYIWDEAGQAWEEILTSEEVYALVVAKGSKNAFIGESTYQNITISDIYEITLDIDISADPDKYLILDTAVNAQGFEYYKIRIALDLGHTTNYLTPDELFGDNDFYRFGYTKYIRLEMDGDLEQNAFYATGKITSNNQTTLTLDTSFNSSISISEDGAMPGDLYNITDLSTDVLDQVWTINSLADDFILDADAVTLIAEDQDLTDVPVFTFLEKIANQKKWEFWQFTDTNFNDVLKLKDPANFDHSGVTITETDIIDYNKEGFSIEHGFHLMRKEIIVKGSFGVRFPHTITPDESTKKSEIITDPSVKSSAQAKNRAENLENKHTGKQIITTIRLDYKKDPSRYSLLDTGLLIDLVIKSGTQANFTDATSTALLILEAHIQQQGQFMEYSILVTNAHW